MLGASFCVEALQEAIAKYGKPDIMNSDQGSQFTGSAWIMCSEALSEAATSTATVTLLTSIIVFFIA